MKTVTKIVVGWSALIVLMGVVAFCSPKAMAGGKPQPPQEQRQHQSQYQKVTGTSEASSYAGASSDSIALSHGGDATIRDVAAQGGSAHTGDSTASLTLNEAAPENDITFRTAPGISVGGIYPANPCHMPWNAGLSIIGGAGTLGNTRVDPVCQQLEWTRVAFQMGLRDAALHSLCQMDQANGNPHCITDNEWQDYNLEMGRVQDDNRTLTRQWNDAVDRIKVLEEELQDAQNKAIVCQVEEACGK